MILGANRLSWALIVGSIAMSTMLCPHVVVADLGWCSEESEVGEECKADYEDLRPTQFAIGKRAARQKAERIREEDEASTLKEYLKDRLIPVVIRKERIYILDRHHLLYGLHVSGVERSKVYAEVVANWSDLTEVEFQKRMKARHYFFDHDENGHAGLKFSDLPKSIASLKDDPYRSLAYEVREQGGFKKTKVFYAEFAWADFFRTRITKASLRSNFARTVKKALALAHSDAAKGLPGYTKRSCADELR